MSEVAFYAPMKAPNHPRPSGDRQLARLFARALRTAGYSVTPAAQLRSWDGGGDQQRQTAIAARGERIAEALVRRWRRQPPAAWFTYHLYHKAPDWIGPRVCRELAIPYIAAEVSIADKQRDGEWRMGYAASLEAVSAAAALICLNPGDREALLRYRPASVLHLMAPFCDAPSPNEPDSRRAGRTPRLIVVAMMRAGDKLESYRQLAGALQRIRELDWELTVVGDGSQRAGVGQLLVPCAERVRYLGCVDSAEMQRALAGSDLCIWPAHNEALGMALLEAQMCGVPVVAGRSPGVAAIVEHGHTGLLTEPGDVGAFAAAVRELLDDPARRRAMGHAAEHRSRALHGIDAAAHRLREILHQCQRRKAG